MLTGTSLFSAVLYLYCGIGTVTSRKKVRIGKQLNCKVAKTAKSSFGFLVMASVRKVPIIFTGWSWEFQLDSSS